MWITLTNLFINVVDPLTTNPWEMATYLLSDNNGQAYKIDEIAGEDSRLSLTFTCKYPCLACDPATPDVCLSCNEVDNMAILFEE